jgi:hypothetical protein
MFLRLEMLSKYVEKETNKIYLTDKHEIISLQYEKDLQKVLQDGFELRNIKEQTPEICLAAVNNLGWCLMYVKQQTDNIFIGQQ